jgi:signal peptidase II
MTLRQTAARLRPLALGGAAALLVGCDHASKQVASSTLEGGPPHPVVGRLLDLRYVENRDAAFEVLRWLPAGVRSILLLVVGAAALVILTTLLLRRRTFDLPGAALLFLLAGAAGNYADRLVRGYVVDFIHVPHWPVFNVADVYVAVGVGLMLLAHWRRPAPAAST